MRLERGYWQWNWPRRGGGQSCEVGVGDVDSDVAQLLETFRTEDIGIV